MVAACRVSTKSYILAEEYGKPRIGDIERRSYLLTVFHNHVKLIKRSLAHSHVEYIDNIRMSERPEDRYLPKRSDWNAIMPFCRKNPYKLQGDDLLVASVACTVDDAVSYALEISYFTVTSLSLKHIFLVQKEKDRLCRFMEIDSLILFLILLPSPRPFNF